MAGVVTGVLQTTLLVLYFTAPAKTVHLNGSLKAKGAFEQTQMWALQSTSQIPTENPNACVANGVLLLQKFAAVSTVTVRLYCLCPQEAIKNFKVCDQAKQQSDHAFSRLNLPAPPAAIIEIGPGTQIPASTEGQ
jgi:hypothetical protein